MILNSDQISEALVELERRSKHELSVYKPGQLPGWNQYSFHQSQDTYRLLFGGNKSGKSYSAAAEISYWATGKHPFRSVPEPPNTVWVISVEYETIKTGIYYHLRRLIPDWELEHVGPKVPNTNLPSFIKLKNGSEITFKSAKGDDRKKFQAATVDLISIDEEVSGDLWDELQARTLVSGGQFIISATLLESYEWIVDLEERAEKKEPGYFITRLETDVNPYIHTDTLNRLKKSWSKEIQDVRIKGRSKRATGLVYNTWKDTSHWIAPFKIPLDWPRWTALDPGIRTFAVLWIAVGPDNKAYAYRELYCHGEPLYEIAKSIKEAERWKFNEELSFRYNHYVWDEAEESEHMVSRVIDDKRNSRLITGDEGVMDQLALRYGISCTPAQKELRPGIEDVRWWLDNQEDGKPGLQIFNTLEHFYWEIKRYRIRSKETRKESNEPIDQPIRKDNHLMDCIRYLARERPQWVDRLMAANWQDKPVFEKDVHKVIALRNKKKDYVDEYLGSVL